jgi:hypothetical protein
MISGSEQLSTGQETTMSTPARIRKALNALEARRVAIERLIVDDMERKFFTAPQADIASIAATTVVRKPGLNLGADIVDTTNLAQHTMVWFR